MKKWKIWLGIAIIFLGGIFIGVFGTCLVVKHHVNISRQGPQLASLRTMRRPTRGSNERCAAAATGLVGSETCVSRRR